jgi:hypothetical protein
MWKFLNVRLIPFYRTHKTVRSRASNLNYLHEITSKKQRTFGFMVVVEVVVDVVGGVVVVFNDVVTVTFKEIVPLMVEVIEIIVLEELKISSFGEMEADTFDAFVAVELEFCLSNVVALFVNEGCVMLMLEEKGEVVAGRTEFVNVKDPVVASNFSCVSLFTFG